MHVAFTIPCVYDYITKFYRTEIEVILNHEKPNAHGIEQEEAIRGLNFGGRGRSGLRPIS
jgi:hypothetical protein